MATSPKTLHEVEGAKQLTKDSPGLLASPVTLMKRGPPGLPFFLLFLELLASPSESLLEELLLEPLSLPEELESLYRQ